MAVSNDRIFQIAVAVIAFQLSIPIAGLILPIQPIEGVTNIELIELGLSSWQSWSGLGIGALAAVAGLAYRVPLGAVAYATVFGIGSVPLGATISQFTKIFGTTSQATAVLDGLSGAIIGLMTVLFVWTFIKLAR